MKKIIQLLSIIIAILVSYDTDVFSATLILDAPTDASTNGEPLSVTISVDSEGKALSAISGVLSFPTDSFDIQSITTRSSVVSLWVTQPKKSTVERTSSRTNIPFEGIIPGGFTGVRSPYYQGGRPGLVFIVTLLPKKASVATLSLDNVEFHLFDAQGTTVKIDSIHSSINVPTQSIVYNSVTRDLALTYSTTLDVGVVRDPLIANNAWHLLVVEDESTRPIDRIFVVETREYNSGEVKDSDWEEVNNMYVIKNQLRTKYIHVKVLYENNTYMIKTIAPVENSSGIPNFSRILISILCVMILGAFLYLYVKKNNEQPLAVFLHNKKNTTKK